jgi:hypothetical protein
MRTAITAGRNTTIEFDVLDMAPASAVAMSFPGGRHDAPCRNRGHQKRDQHVVAGQREAEKTPLHFIAADHLDGVETLQQAAGAAEIPDRPCAFGRPLPKPPFDAGVIGPEPGIAERGEREDGEAEIEHRARRVFRRGQRNKHAERDRQIVGVALLEAERTGADIQHQLKEPRARQRRRGNDRDRQRCSEHGVGIAARMRPVCGGVKRHIGLLEHDPEKWEPVFRKGNARKKSGEERPILLALGCRGRYDHCGVSYSVDAMVQALHGGTVVSALRTVQPERRGLAIPLQLARYAG